jgi:phospholipid/cholesterol/gamma-HCH transport system substrate-binding protein
MRNTLETRLGIFVALAVIAAVLILEVVHGPIGLQRGVELKALFNNVQDLKEGDRVKMGGAEVGRIEQIGLDETNNKVIVTMRLRATVGRQKIVVRTDSIATIKFTGLMGQNYIALSFGSPGSPLATDGTVLTSKEEPDLSAMMSELHDVAVNVKNMTASFTGDKIDNLLGPFTDFLKANRVPLTAAIANLQAVSTQISQGKGTVGKMIYDESLYNSTLAAVTNLQDTADQIKTTVADARKVVDQVNAGQGTMGLLLHDEALYRETTASMTNLKEILEKINQGQGTVGKIVNDQDLYKNAKLTLQKLDKATEGLEDQGPLSVMGILVNKFF